MKIVKKIKDKWELTDNDGRTQMIHYLEREPTIEELYDAYIVYEQVTNFAALYLVYATSPDLALEVAIEMKADSDRLTAVEQVKIEF